MEFKDIVKKNIAVYCSTKKESKKFIKLCKANGYEPPNESHIRENVQNNVKKQNDGICYIIGKSVYSLSVFGCLFLHHHIIEFKEIS